MRAVGRSWYRDLMNTKVCLPVLACAIALSACADDAAPADTGTTGDDTATTDAVVTTIPVTSVTDTMTDPTTAGSTSSTSGSDASTDSDTDTTSSSGSETESSASTSTGDAEGSTSTGDDTTTGAGSWDIEWCNLQFPPMIEGTTATSTTAYARVYVAGLTDQTPGNDLDAQLEVEFGYGADDSDPSADDWTWVPGVGNAGWNGNDAGQPNNDEYQGDLQFGAAGTYDYAARVSGDGGTAWVYCDLNGLVEGGYTSDQAGNAIIE